MSEEKVNPLSVEEEAKRQSFAESLHLNHQKRFVKEVATEDREAEIGAAEKERDEWMAANPGVGLKEFHRQREEKRQALQAQASAPAEESDDSKSAGWGKRKK